MSGFRSDNPWHSTLVLIFFLIMSDVTSHAMQGTEDNLHSRVKLATWAYFEGPYAKILNHRKEKTIPGFDNNRPPQSQKTVCRISCGNQYREKCAVLVNGQLCRCSYKYIPYCGNDGITYVNKCWLDCARENCNIGLRKKFEGVCARPHSVNDWGRRIHNFFNFIV